jgi:UDP-N-acetylglucosamine 4-epimerase|tara:strand:+ start:9858 stop:10853 length:996 start_codon:yes stop_codon:yes gene_type:complete
MNRIKGKRVLVTGGAGFIGSNICVDLVKDNEVVCLDSFITGKRENLESLKNNSKFNLIEGDIRNEKDCQKALQGVDIVLHQAALGSVPRSIENPILTNSINIDGFLMMLNQSQKMGVKRFVYAASSSTYGDHPGLPKIEENIGSPLSPYAVTKYVNELYAKVFFDLHGMEVIGLRYFNVFGRHQDPDGAYAAAIPKFIKAFLSGAAPTVHGDGEQSRDFTYIENVLQANHLAAITENKLAIGEVFNVAFGDRTTVNELTSALRANLTKFDASISNIEINYVAERKGDVKHSLASIEKAQSLLNYNPQFSLEKGLDEAINWYFEYFKNKAHV